MAYFILSEDYYARVYEADKPESQSINDTTIVFILELLVAAGYDRVCFYDRDDRWSVPEFVQWAKSPDKLFCIIYRKDATPISVTWLNGFSQTGHQAYAHFSTLKTAAPEECLESGRMLLKCIVAVTRIKQFIGITPVCYRHAVSFAKELGFKPLDTLKKHVVCKGKERDVMLSICEPKEDDNG